MAPFQPAAADRDCKDDDDKCEEWAVMGECESPRPSPLHAAVGSDLG